MALGKPFLLTCRGGVVQKKVLKKGPFTPRQRGKRGKESPTQKKEESKESDDSKGRTRCLDVVEDKKKRQPFRIKGEER